MGYPMDLFVSNVDEEFICGICKDVMKNPTMTADCSHVFYSGCIRTWMNSSARPTCPIDRARIKHKLIEPFRPYMNMYHRLLLKCPFDGCGHVSNLGQIEHHAKDCDMNPINREINKPCPGNCGAHIKNKDVGKHSCVEYLKEQLEEKNAEIVQLKQELEETKASKNKLLNKQVVERRLLTTVVEPGTSPSSKVSKKDEERRPKHFYIDVETKSKFEALYHLCDNFYETRAIILCNNSETVASVWTKMIREKRYQRLLVWGQVTTDPHQQKRLMEQFWSSSNSILNTTSELFSSLDTRCRYFVVIYYNLPTNPHFYFHRINEYGEGNEVLSMLTKEDQPILKEIEKLYNIQIVEAYGFA